MGKHSSHFLSHPAFISLLIILQKTCSDSYLERVDARVHPALLDVGDLLSDAEQGVAEAVHLCLVFRLGGLDHQSAGHRPGHGGCVETWTRSSQPVSQPVSQSGSSWETSDVRTSHPTIVLQPLGHVDGFDVCRLLEGPHVQNELMGDKTCSDAEFEKLIQTV